MRFARRAALALLLLGWQAAPGPAAAADLRVIAPSAPGSGWDQVAQALRSALAETAGAPPASVVNAPGGAGTVGLAQFAGSTSNDDLLVTGLTMLDAAIIGRSPVTLDRLTPIARLVSEPYVVVVPASSALRSMDDLRTALAGTAAKINWAGGPVGSVDHVGAILFLKALGLEPGQVNYVPFLTSAEASAAAAEERVHVAFLATGEVLPALAEGKLVPLGLAAPARLPEIPVATLTEAGIPLAYANWRGILARSGLADADRLRLEALVSRAASSDAWRRFMAKRGWREAYLGGDAFGALIRDDQIRMKEALKAAGIIKRAAE